MLNVNERRLLQITIHSITINEIVIVTTAINIFITVIAWCNCAKGASYYLYLLYANQPHHVITCDKLA